MDYPIKDTSVDLSERWIHSIKAYASIATAAVTTAMRAREAVAAEVGFLGVGALVGDLGVGLAELVFGVGLEFVAVVGVAPPVVGVDPGVAPEVTGDPPVTSGVGPFGAGEPPEVKVGLG